MLERSRTTRVTALGCVVLVGSLLVPGTAAADPAAAPPKSIQATGRTLASRQALALTEVRAAQAAPPATQPDLQSGSFFKSKVGVAVIAAFGAGVGYALYSASNDRIKSQGR